MTALSVDFGAKDGHDFNQVRAELFHGGLVVIILAYGDFDSHELADLEYDFTAESEQSVFVCQDEFFDFPLQDEQK